VSGRGARGDTPEMRELPNGAFVHESAYVDAGAAYVILALRAPFDRDALERFASEVVPAVRA